MSGQQHALYPVLTQLCAEPRADGRGTIITVTSPRTGTGTSYVARTLALLAAEHYGPHDHRVALIDMDLAGQAQSTYFQSPGSQTLHGAVHGPYDATFGQEPFWQVSPDMIAPDGSRQSGGVYCCLHLVAETGLAFSQFQWAQIKSGQSVHVAHTSDYWKKIREHFAVIIVDTPAFDRADTALSVISESDKTTIVTHADFADYPENKDLAARIASMNGHCAGMILNQGVPAASVAAKPG